mgnify:CR=1 FL=1
MTRTSLTSFRSSATSSKDSNRTPTKKGLTSFTGQHKTRKMKMAPNKSARSFMLMLITIICVKSSKISLKTLLNTRLPARSLSISLAMINKSLSACPTPASAFRAKTKRTYSKNSTASTTPTRAKSMAPVSVYTYAAGLPKRSAGAYGLRASIKREVHFLYQFRAPTMQPRSV